MSMLVFWVITPFGLVVRYQRFGGTHCLHLQGLSSEDGGGMFLRNVGIYLQVHTALRSRGPTRHAHLFLFVCLFNTLVN
jgi:hypothetical protein